MITRLAGPDDFAGIMALAAQVEHLFGAMVRQRGFQQALSAHIDRKSALVAVSPDIVGGLLFDPKAPVYHVDWLVVSAQVRGTGVGSALMADAMHRFTRGPGRIEVVTFGPDHPGAAARDFYVRHGFSPGLMSQPGPEGGARQIYTKSLPAPAAGSLGG